MGIQTQFQKFHDSIKLTREDDAYSDAREKDNSITDQIKSAFKEAGYEVKSTFIQGSFAIHTAIKSLDGDFDLDRAIVIDSDDAPENPVECKITLHDVLEARGFKNARIKKPCVTADYSSLDLHIDFPVYKHGFILGHRLAVGKRNSSEENREWLSSDPEGLIVWVNDDTIEGHWSDLSKEEKAQFRRIVRYVKRWRDVQYTDPKHIYSIGLTIMLKKSLRTSIDDEDRPNDLLALYDTIDCLLEEKEFFTLTNSDPEKYTIQIDLPVDPFTDIFQKHGETVGTELRRKFVRLRKKLKEAIDESSLKKQYEILSDMFGDDFPIPDEDPKGGNKVYMAASGIVVPNQGA